MLDHYDQFTIPKRVTWVAMTLRDSAPFTVAAFSTVSDALNYVARHVEMGGNARFFFTVDGVTTPADAFVTRGQALEWLAALSIWGGWDEYQADLAARRPAA